MDKEKIVQTYQMFKNNLIEHVNANGEIVISELAENVSFNDILAAAGEKISFHMLKGLIREMYITQEFDLTLRKVFAFPQAREYLDEAVKAAVSFSSDYDFSLVCMENRKFLAEINKSPWTMHNISEHKAMLKLRFYNFLIEEMIIEDKELAINTEILLHCPKNLFFCIPDHIVIFRFVEDISLCPEYLEIMQNKQS